MKNIPISGIVKQIDFSKDLRSTPTVITLSDNKIIKSYKYIPDLKRNNSFNALCEIRNHEYYYTATNMVTSQTFTELNRTDYRFEKFIDFKLETILEMMTSAGINLNEQMSIIEIAKEYDNNINNGLFYLAEDMFANNDKSYYKFSLCWKFSLTHDILSYAVKFQHKPWNEIVDLIKSEFKVKKIPFLFNFARLQLLMLKVTDKQMKKIRKSANDGLMSSIDLPNAYSIESLYTKFLSNPYAWYPIPIALADEIMITTERLDFGYERDWGLISRKIYEFMNVQKWTCVPKAELIRHYPKLMDYTGQLIENYGIIFDNNCIYLLYAYEQELQVANFIRTHNGFKFNNDELIFDNLTDEQNQALNGCLINSITVVSGLAGSGKTTLIRQIIEVLIERNQKLVICGFTGKSVEKVRTVTKIANPNVSIKTIHSILQTPDLQANYVIIDESTMVSLALLARLFTYFNNQDIRLIMLGDVNQLPSLTYGRPFEDILMSKVVPTFVLTKNLRVLANPEDRIIINSTNIVESVNFEAIVENNFLIYSAGSISKDIEKLINHAGITKETIKDHKFITATNDMALTINETIVKLIVKAISLVAVINL